MPEVAGIRRFGAAALDLAWVAAGRFDGFWEHGLPPWDIAAGVLLVREAGGYVTDLKGGDTIAGNRRRRRRQRRRASPASRASARLNSRFRFHLPPETRYKFAGPGV